MGNTFASPRSGRRRERRPPGGLGPGDRQRAQQSQVVAHGYAPSFAGDDASGRLSANLDALVAQTPPFDIAESTESEPISDRTGKTPTTRVAHQGRFSYGDLGTIHDTSGVGKTLRGPGAPSRAGHQRRRWGTGWTYQNGRGPPASLAPRSPNRSGVRRTTYSSLRNTEERP